MPAARARSVKKRRYHHGDLREALLREARRSVEQEGHPALAIRALARRLGVTHTAAFHHFPTREALLAGVAEQAFRAMNAALVAEAGRATTCAERLARVAQAYVEHALGHPATYRLMFGAEAASGEAFAELATASNELFATLSATLREAQAEGTLRSGPAAELGLVTWAALHGLCSLLIEGRLQQPGLVNLPRERLTAIALEGVFSGLGAPARA